MSTVNNMLKLNRWAETTVSRKPVGPQDWTQFEEDILYEVDQAMPDHETAEVSIFFNNHLASSDPSTTLVDMALLKECVQSLVLNSLQATKHGGAVVIVIDASADRSLLTVDVMDSGCGIAPSDYTRIFEAYEKVDIHSRGAGLGLTLAANIAKLMQGDVVLVSSSQDPQKHGSHFRATVATPLQSSPTLNATTTSESKLSTEIPVNQDAIAFDVIRGTEQDASLLSNFTSYLEQHGFQQMQSSQKSLYIIPYTPESLLSHEETVAANPTKLFISLTPATTSPPQNLKTDRIRLFPGPFTSTRLQQITTDMKQAWETLQIEPSSPSSQTTRSTTKNGQYKVSTVELHTQQDNDQLLLPLPANKAALPYALLVDDNMVNLKIMQMYCLKRGIEHITAINGEEAVARFTEQWEANRPPNLILMDLQMPVCDGLEAVQRIRAIENNNNNDNKADGPGGAVMGASPPPRSRIFMVTGQDSSADKARSFAAGADEFYVKPMGMKKLDLGIVQYFGSSVFQK